MMTRNKKIIFPIVAGVIFIAGLFFLAKHFGVFQKRSIVISRPNSNSNQQSGDLTQQEIQPQDQNNKQPQDAIDQSANIKNIASTKNTSSNSVKASSSSIVARLVSWGFQKSSGRTIDTIIVHTSFDAIGNDPYNVEGIIAEWKAAGVSPHYLIGRDGTTYQLVADQNIAWHAGVSKMPDGRINVNDFSIGVEMVNTMNGKFTDAQYAALNQLIKILKGKYPIKNVLGHDDIAPGRKTDPWGMDWSRVNR